MKKIGVAILGLGVVGGGAYQILTQHAGQFQKVYNLDIKVVGVLEKDANRALALGVNSDIIADNIEEICSDPEVDIVVETIGGVEPAKSFQLAALNAGKSVVTSNKELYCKYGHELEKAAKHNHVGLFYEATCVGGVPVVRALLDSLQGNTITSVTGIINGTTNYILTKMSTCNRGYAEVLKEAQTLGYAEADPTSDVEGYDAAYKLSILSGLCFHTKIPYTNIHREGIASLDPADIEYGKRLGYTIKLLAIGKNTPKGIEVRVHPAFVPNSHPLASVSDSYNAVYIKGDSVDDVMFYGRGAGALPTGSAIVGDIIYCATHTQLIYSPFENTEHASPDTKFVSNFKSAYYIRFRSEDKAGELSKVTAALGKCGISVAQVSQFPCGDGLVELIVITHATREENLNKALGNINRETGSSVHTVLRVEN